MPPTATVLTLTVVSPPPPLCPLSPNLATALRPWKEQKIVNCSAMAARLETGVGMGHWLNDMKSLYEFVGLLLSQVSNQFQYSYSYSYSYDEKLLSHDRALCYSSTTTTPRWVQGATPGVWTRRKPCWTILRRYSSSTVFHLLGSELYMVLDIETSASI